MTAIYGRYALFLSLILAFVRKGITHIGQALFYCQAGCKTPYPKEPGSLRPPQTSSWRGSGRFWARPCLHRRPASKDPILCDVIASQ